jgi:cbb3-type cytochrome oxidase cytochrome c subunit
VVSSQFETTDSNQLDMNSVIIKSSIIICFISVIVISACTSQKKIVYVFPDAMSKPVQDEYTRLSEKGRVLYELNCAGCHNKKVKGKTVIPDFTEEEMGAYSIRIANAIHEEKVSEERVSAEELNLITYFFRYKKKAVTK